MKAVLQDVYGPPEVLRVAETERPTARAGEVLVQVEAAGLGPEVWHVVAGLAYPVRLFTGLRRPRQPIAGRDFAGRVAAVGEGVDDFKEGDAVFGTGIGTFAEYTRAEVGRIAHLPAGLGFAEAAVVPVSGVTALQAIRDHAKVKHGHKVAVLGAGGGIGTFAVQLAKRFGAEVTGVCGTDKTELVRSLGADHVVDYTVADFADGPDRFDAVIDTAGHRPLAGLRRAITPMGVLVMVGSEVDGCWLGGMDRAMRANLMSPFTSQRFEPFFARENRADLEALAGYLADGRLAPVIGSSFPLEEAPQALRRWRDGHSRGKTVITIGAEAQGPF